MSSAAVPVTEFAATKPASHVSASPLPDASKSARRASFHTPTSDGMPGHVQSSAIDRPDCIRSRMSCAACAFGVAGPEAFVVTWVHPTSKVA